MLKNALYFCFFVIFGLFFIGSVYALGVSPSVVYYDFQPGLKGDQTFTIFNKTNNEIKVVTGFFEGGELTNYFEILDKEINVPANGRGSVKVRFELPQKMDKIGKNIVKLIMKEIPKTKAGTGGTAITAATAIIVRLEINVPCEGKCAEILKLNVENHSLEELKKSPFVDIGFIIHNTGKQTIDGTYKIEVTRGDNKFFELTKDFDPLEGLGLREIKEVWNIQDIGEIKAGEYAAKVSLNFGGEAPATSRKKFIIGKRVFASRIKYEAFEGDKIIQLEVGFRNLSSENEKITSTARLLKDQEAISESQPLEFMVPANSGAAKDFFLPQTENIVAGDYEMEITTEYRDGTSTDRFPFVVKKKEETKKSLGFKFPQIDTTTLLLILVIVVLAIVVGFIFLKRRKRDEFVY